MITATITYQEKVTMFEVNGHANYAEYGKDIVCSSVTTAVFTTLGLLEKLLNKNEYNYTEKEGLIKFETTNCSELIRTIFQNFQEVLENIERQYPKNLKLKIAKN